MLGGRAGIAKLLYINDLIDFYGRVFGSIPRRTAKKIYTEKRIAVRFR